MQLRDLNMSMKPRQAFQYDSNAYLALAHMVPTLTGIPYHEFLIQEIFKPLDMKGAKCDSNQVRVSGQAVDGFLRKGGNPNQEGVEKLGKPCSVGWWTTDDGLWCLPHGGLAMTIIDAVSDSLGPSF